MCPDGPAAASGLCHCLVAGPAAAVGQVWVAGPVCFCVACWWWLFWSSSLSLFWALARSASSGAPVYAAAAVGPCLDAIRQVQRHQLFINCCSLTCARVLLWASRQGASTTAGGLVLLVLAADLWMALCGLFALSSSHPPSICISLGVTDRY